MKFFVAVLAVLAVGSVSAQFTDLEQCRIALLEISTDIFTNVGYLTDTFVANVAVFTTAVQTELTTQANNAITSIEKLPDLCQLAESPGLIQSLLNLVFGLLGSLLGGTPRTIGTIISDIIGYVLTGAQIIASALPTFATYIFTTINTILSSIKLAATTAIAGVELITQGNVAFVASEFQADLLTIIQAVQTVVITTLSGLSNGPFGELFGATIETLTTKADLLLTQLTCLTGKIVSVSALRNILVQLNNILTALDARGIA